MLPALIGAGAAAAAGGIIAYGAMAPSSQLFGTTFSRGANERQIGLTYDDGPNTKETLLLLDVLARHSAKATFFLIGKYVKAEPRIARAIVEQGHTVANHTFTHPSLFWTSPRQDRK